MSNITQFFSGGGGGVSPGRNSRRIYRSPGTFVAPPTTNQVEINPLRMQFFK